MSSIDAQQFCISSQNPLKNHVISNTELKLYQWTPLLEWSAPNATGSLPLPSSMITSSQVMEIAALPKVRRALFSK